VLKHARLLILMKIMVKENAKIVINLVHHVTVATITFVTHVMKEPIYITMNVLHHVQ